MRCQASQAAQSRAALALIRALRVELHASQRLCGALLLELASCCDAECKSRASGAPLTHLTRLASLQDVLHSHQKR